MLRIGVIGVGVMGGNHARVYSELPEVELVGVADVNYNVAQEIASRYDTTPFVDFKELLRQGLDAVSIAVPTSLHRELAVEAARAKVNMLVEKPIADTLEAARDIVRIAEDNNVKLMVGHIERFNPIIPVIKDIIADSEVSLIEVVRIGSLPPRIKDVGIIIDLATHDIDLIRYISGSEFKTVYSLASRNISQKEDVAVLLFEMVNGTLARATASWLTPFKVREISIATKDKFIKGSLLEQKVAEYGKYEEGVYTVRELYVPAEEPLKLELKAFLESIRENREVPISGDDGLKTLEIAIKCLNQRVIDYEQ